MVATKDANEKARASRRNIAWSPFTRALLISILIVVRVSSLVLPYRAAKYGVGNWLRVLKTCRKIMLSVEDRWWIAWLGQLSIGTRQTKWPVLPSATDIGEYKSLYFIFRSRSVYKQGSIKLVDKPGSSHFPSNFNRRNYNRWNLKPSLCRVVVMLKRSTGFQVH